MPSIILAVEDKDVKLWKKPYPERTIKAICTVAFAVLLYRQLMRHHTLEVFSSIEPDKFIRQHAVSLSCIGLLMVFSILIEAVKWRILARHLTILPFASAIKATLSGYCVSFFTPNRTGEFAGRIIYLPQEQRMKGAILTIAGSYSQLICTLLGGIWATALCRIHQSSPPLFILIALIVVCGAITIILLVSFFNIRFLTPLIGQIKFLSKFQQQVAVLNVLPLKTLIYVMALSIIKYIVFNFQFAWLLQMQGMPFTPVNLLYLLPLIFFIQTVIPSFAWAELGLRGSVAIYILHATSLTLIPILLASTLLWIINIIIPAISGGAYLLHHKFKAS